MNDVNTYIESFEGECRDRLRAIQNIIKTEVPDAVESISYGLVGYKLMGKPLIYFGGFKEHIGLYATPNTHALFKKEFAKYKQGKGSVQFPLDQPLPVELIHKIVAHRKKMLSSS